MIKYKKYISQKLLKSNIKIFKSRLIDALPICINEILYWHLSAKCLIRNRGKPWHYKLIINQKYYTNIASTLQICNVTYVQNIPNNLVN